MGAFSLIVVINLLNRFVMGKSASKLSPEKLEEYLQKTAFSESEVRMWHKYFMNDYPEGKMTQDQFVDVYRLFHPDGKPEQFAMHVFRVFDCGNKGHLTFDDFLLSLNVTARGTNSDKVLWTFSLYDTDNDRRISKDELLNVIDSIYQMIGKSYANDETRKQAAVTKVDNLFAAMDVDRDSYISFEEFKEGVEDNPDILRVIQQGCSFFTRQNRLPLVCKSFN